MSVWRAQHEISHAEFIDWMAYYALEPFGPRMDDLRMGVVASTVANTQRAAHARVLTPADFIYWQDEQTQGPPAPQAVAALFGIDLAEVARNGGRLTVQRKK